MKRFIFLISTLTIYMSVIAQTNIDPRSYIDLSQTISKVSKPIIKDNYLIFTAASKYRHVGIAFEHENYKTIHTFKRLPEGCTPTKNNILFYIMKIPEATHNLKYRLVMDGLWTTDPMNPDQLFDYSLSMSVSKIDVPFKKEYKTKKQNNDGTTFVYEGRTGQIIRLAGTFNNWDPFMYELQEVLPGKYELTLALPKGTWIYAYFKGSSQIPDPTNGNRVYTADGQIASVLHIQ